MKSSTSISSLEKRGLALEEKMFNIRSRHLMLFLTLNYKPEYRADITLATLNCHRDRLLKNIACNPLLQGINAYIWKIEEGQKAGLHMHLLIFYAGDRRADIHIAQCIGDYWRTIITRGVGDYWNSNADKNRLAAQKTNIGVGQINRGDIEGRNGIRQIIRYMARPGQEIKDRPWHGRRYGMSEIPN